MYIYIHIDKYMYTEAFIHTHTQINIFYADKYICMSLYIFLAAITYSIMRSLTVSGVPQTLQVD